MHVLTQNEIQHVSGGKAFENSVTDTMMVYCGAIGVIGGSIAGFVIAEGAAAAALVAVPYGMVLGGMGGMIIGMMLSLPVTAFYHLNGWDAG